MQRALELNVEIDRPPPLVYAHLAHPPNLIGLQPPGVAPRRPRLAAAQTVYLFTFVLICEAPMLDLNAAFAMFPVRATARFVLREPQPGDAPRIFEIMSDPRVTRYFGMLPMDALAAAEQRVAGWGAAFAAREGVRWAIAERAGGRLLGTCGFWRLVPEHDRAEIGYELAPECWGQGVMPEALAAVLDFGFANMRLHSVEAQIHPANVGSRRVLEKLGFVQEGYFRENYHDVVEGGYTDTAVFSLLARDWQRRG